MDFAVKQNTEKQKEKSLPFWKTIKEMPLSSFLECLCNSNYEFLYKETPEARDEVQEKEHFFELYQQFSDAFNKDDASKLLSDIKRKTKLWTKINILGYSLTLIEKLPENIIKVLKNYGIRITNDIHKDVLIITGKRSSFLREYNELIKEKKEKTTDEISFDKYMELLFEINIRFKLNLNADNITVYTFCGYYNKFIKSINEENRLNKKYHGRKH